MIDFETKKVKEFANRHKDAIAYTVGGAIGSSLAAYVSGNPAYLAQIPAFTVWGAKKDFDRHVNEEIEKNVPYTLRRQLEY